jgi:hypothetical protein
MVKDNESKYARDFGGYQRTLLRLLIDVGVYWAGRTERYAEVDFRWLADEATGVELIVISFSTVSKLQEFLREAINNDKYHKPEEGLQEYKQLIDPRFTGFNSTFTNLHQNLELLGLPFFEKARNKKGGKDSDWKFTFRGDTSSHNINDWRELIEEKIKEIDDSRHGSSKPKKALTKPVSTSSSIPHNIPPSGLLDGHFVGRKNQLKTLQSLLEPESSRVSIVAGGGYGKTELILQFLKQNSNKFRGGICWVYARQIDSISEVKQEHIAYEIIQFCEGRLKLQIPKTKTTCAEQIKYCFDNWNENGEVLVIFDDLESTEDYSKIKKFIPNDARFHTLITSRLKIGSPFQEIDLDLLTPSECMEFFEITLGSDRVKSQRKEVEALIERLECLPLAIELISRRLANDTSLRVSEIRSLLDKAIDSNTITTSITLQKETGAMTAPRGFAEAMDLTWQTLSETTQFLGMMIGSNPCPDFSWKSEVYSAIRLVGSPENGGITLEEIAQAKRDLINNNLIKPTGEEDTYRCHSLVSAYFKCKFLEHG